MAESLRLNDCHVHLGKSSSIYQTFNQRDILKFKTAKTIENMLIFGTEIDYAYNNQIVKTTTECYDGIYGLYWGGRDDEFRLEGKMIGMKYHGAYNHRAIRPNFPSVKSLPKGSILMVHCGRYLEGHPDSNTSYVHALEVAKEHPELIVIMAHMGGTDTTVCKNAILDSKPYYNILFDTSGITTPYIIEFAYQQIGSERIIFGSDAPWCSFGAMLHTVLDANIPENAKIVILYENFRDLIEWKYEPRMELSKEKLQLV